MLTFAEEIKTQLGLKDMPVSDEEQMLSENIGDAFDSFLDPYVKMERSKLDEIIQSMLLQEEQANEAEVAAKLSHISDFVLNYMYTQFNLGVPPRFDL